MQFRHLPRNGLNLSRVGLGLGGGFGEPQRHDPQEMIRLVHAAVDLGINYFDTAPMYPGSEELLGRALRQILAVRVHIATKFFPVRAGTEEIISPDDLRASVETSLRRLGVTTLDVLQIHGLRPHWTQPVLERLGETLETLRTEGIVGALGVTETIVDDPHHAMVPLALAGRRFASAAIAYNFLSPWAELAALPACLTHETAAIAMLPVRPALRDPVLLHRLLARGRERGEIPPAALPEHGPLDWLLDAHVPTLAAAGCKYVAAHPAIACVLTGTKSIAHLRENIAAVHGPPLPDESMQRLRRIFLRTNPISWKPSEL